LLALALCHEESGRPATALREYRESLRGAVRANRSDRVMLAESHVQKLEASVPRVLVRLPSPEPDGLALTLDGAPIDRATIADGAAVDPGRHTLVASARDSVPWQTSVLVEQPAARIVVQVPSLASSLPTRRTPAPHSRRTAGWLLAGLGAAAVAGGSVAGLLAFDAEARSKPLCPGNRCSQDGLNLNHDASRDALASDIAFAAGGVALAAGLFLLLRPSSTAMIASPSLHPWVGQGGGGVAGRW
jgi:hypothetical protein